MIPVVSDKYRYIFFYNPKSACSVARKLFLELHRNELSDQQAQSLAMLRANHQDEWHALDELFPLDKDRDYQDYFKFTLVRHPAMRVISAYLNRVVLKMTDQEKIAASLSDAGADHEAIAFTFSQFLEYLSVAPPREVGNFHFLPQSFLTVNLRAFELRALPSGWMARLKLVLMRKFGLIDENTLILDEVCKVESLQEDLSRVYKKIFKQDTEKARQALELIADLPLHNVTYSSEEQLKDACNVPAHELRALGQMPNYASFLDSNTLSVIEDLFKKDFRLFDYSVDPAGSVVGFERSKHRAVRASVPKDFDWQAYVSLNPDLSVNGVDNKADAINHWIHHGRFEDRRYR